MTKTTAPANETPDRTQQRAPLMDFSSISADDAPPITRGAGGGDKFAKLDGTPFVGYVTETKDAGHAKSIPCPSQEAAKQVAYMLRLAAEKANVGVRIPNTNGLYPEVDGKVRVTFQGTERRKYDGHRKPVRRNAETDSEFETRVGEWETTTGRKFDE